jgi:hypothetical protein
MTTKKEHDFHAITGLLEYEDRGFKCRVVKIPHLGHLCGYVGLPESHKYFNKDMDAIDIYCHGGITYSEKEKDGLYWIGFDCAHAGDLVPGLVDFKISDLKNDSPEMMKALDLIEDTMGKLKFPEIIGTYKNLDYVKRELKEIVNQLVEEELD